MKKQKFCIIQITSLNVTMLNERFWGRNSLNDLTSDFKNWTSTVVLSICGRGKNDFETFSRIFPNPIVPWITSAALTNLAMEVDFTNTIRDIFIIGFTYLYCNKRVLSLTHTLILKCMSNIVHAWLVYKYTTPRWDSLSP